MMAELALPWPVLAALVASALVGGLFGLVLHTRKALSDLRVELADYRTQVAERYVPFAAQAAFEERWCGAWSASRTCFISSSARHRGTERCAIEPAKPATAVPALGA